MGSHHDIIVVGAGLQGLVAAKTFLQLNPSLDLLIIDSNQSLGGVWAKERLYSGLNANNLVGTYEYTDFPMGESFGVKHPEHIPGEVIHAYLCQYAEHFGLAARIGLRTKVVTAEKVNQGWELKLETASIEPGYKVKVEDNSSRLPAHRTITCIKLVVATGLTSSPQPINIKDSETFGAPIVNFGNYARQAQEIYHDISIKDVTVYGGGKASYDIVYLMAAHGKHVDWVIRASGHGPTYMAPAFIKLGPMSCWLEKLTTVRILTWFSPCVWGDADGFGYLRKSLHETKLGRWVVDTFWTKLGSDLIAQTHIAENAETKKLIPDQPPFWYGANLSILNYPTDIYAFVRTGQVKVIRKDVRCLDRQKTILFEDGSSIRSDALICSMGWKFTSTIDFRPKEIHADLGIPSAEFSRVQTEIWDRLNARADMEIFERFPKLQTGAQVDQGSLVVEQEVVPQTTEREKPPKQVSPWRLFRGIAPLSLHTRDLVFLGNVIQLQGALRSEISSLWAYAYLYDKLKAPLASIARPSVPLHHPNGGKAERDKILYDTALFNRFGKWRTPYGYGARHPDVVFDGVPYFDLLLQDLGLNSWRKGWGWLGEVFGGSYGQADYRGLVDEWKETQRKKQA